MYEEFPLCIQRKVAKRAWGKDWPIYALLGLPNMSKDLEKEGLFDDGNLGRECQVQQFVFAHEIIIEQTCHEHGSKERNQDTDKGDLGGSTLPEGHV